MLGFPLDFPTSGHVKQNCQNHPEPTFSGSVHRRKSGLHESKLGHIALLHNYILYSDLQNHRIHRKIILIYHYFSWNSIIYMHNKILTRSKPHFQYWKAIRLFVAVLLWNMPAVLGQWLLLLLFGLHFSMKPWTCQRKIVGFDRHRHPLLSINRSRCLLDRRISTGNYTISSLYIIYRSKIYTCTYRSIWFYMHVCICMSTV